MGPYSPYITSSIKDVPLLICIISAAEVSVVPRAALNAAGINNDEMVSIRSDEPTLVDFALVTVFMVRPIY